jgi:glycosyltransferase involved in cell wall biosynthesis
MTKKRIGIFVIAYNAVNKLDWTLDRIPQEVWDKVDEVFLFDDCSTDNTYYAAIGYKKRKEPSLRWKSKSGIRIRDCARARHCRDASRGWPVCSRSVAAIACAIGSR